MNTADKIKDYLFRNSAGVINITTDHAHNIIDIVLSQYGRNESAVAKLYRFNNVTEGWELMRTIQTTDEEIKQQVIAALEKTPPEKSYLWECYNQNGEFEGRIYSTNIKLF